MEGECSGQRAETAGPLGAERKLVCLEEVSKAGSRPSWLPAQAWYRVWVSFQHNGKPPQGFRLENGWSDLCVKTVTLARVWGNSMGGGNGEAEKGDSPETVAVEEERRERIWNILRGRVTGLADESNVETRGWENQGWHQASGFGTWRPIAGRRGKERSIVPSWTCSIGDDCGACRGRCQVGSRIYESELGLGIWVGDINLGVVSHGNGY